MKELDDELWKVGVPAKTKHNEAAPSQHELAPVLRGGERRRRPRTRSIDGDACTERGRPPRAGAACEHEKPFEGINGSGKHNNWSLAAGDDNLLDPTDTPDEDLQFLVFLTCIIAAVDEHQDLLRVSVASAGNDHRLGAHGAARHHLDLLGRRSSAAWSRPSSTASTTTHTARRT